MPTDCRQLPPITFNCRQFLNSNPEMSLNMWQTIEANPASHMVALATGFGIALILTMVICVCKWQMRKRSRPKRQLVSTQYLPAISPSPNLSRAEAPTSWENQSTSQFYPETYIPRPPYLKAISTV